MLNEDQDARVDEWLRVAVLTAKDKIAIANKAAITDIENAIAVQKGSDSGSGWDKARIVCSAFGVVGIRPNGWIRPERTHRWEGWGLP